MSARTGGVYLFIASAINEVNSFYMMVVLVPVITGVILWYLWRWHKESGTKKGPVYFISWNLMLTFLLLSTAFLGFETYYRFFADTTDSFGLNKVSVRWFEGHYRFNNVGIRDNIDYYPAKNPVKKYRISFLGDSFTAGHGIKNVDDRFVNIIRKDCPGLEVHCLAVDGMSSKNELDLINRVAAGNYQFDYVVLCYVLNDMVDLMPENKIMSTRIYGDYINEMSYLDTASYFINTWYFRLKARTDPDMSNYYWFVKKGYAGPEWNEHKKCLLQLVDTIQQHGGKLLVVTFPFFNAIGTNNYEYYAIHQQLNNFWTSINVPHLDLSSTFNSYRPEELTVNKYDAHPNEFAHRLAAKSIEDFIRRNISYAAKENSR